MKNNYTKSLIVGALLSACAAGASAEGASVGLKLASLDVDLPGASGDTGLGFNFGYNFNENSAIELEYIPGSGSVDYYGQDVDLDVTSTAVYYAFRSSSDFYFLGKVGLASVKVKAKSGDKSANESDTGLGFAIGAGYQFNDSFGLEADYNIVEADSSFLSLTARFSF